MFAECKHPFHLPTLRAELPGACISLVEIRCNTAAGRSIIVTAPMVAFWRPHLERALVETQLSSLRVDSQQQFQVRVPSPEHDLSVFLPQELDQMIKNGPSPTRGSKPGQNRVSAGQKMKMAKSPETSSKNSAGQNRVKTGSTRVIFSPMSGQLFGVLSWNCLGFSF